MDATIQMMIQGYIDGLESMNTSDESIKQEIEDYKKELLSFAETQNDAVTFFTKFQDSGLMAKYMDLSSKITMGTQTQSQASSASGKPTVTPEKWLEPFRTAYNYIKNLPIRERGLAVYRKLFEIGEKHSDITEFLLEVEKENLLWKLSSEDAIGILNITYTGMDFLYKGLTYPIRKNIEAWNNSVCEADAHYLQDCLAEDIAATPPRLLQPEKYVNNLGLHIMIYRGPKGKEGIMEMIATGNCPKPAFIGNASNMAIAKLQARRTMEIIKKSVGLSFDDILADEFLRYKLISTSNVCGLSKAYVQSNPNIIDLMADAFKNEIMTDISLLEAIKREPSLKLGRWRMPEDREVERAQEIARDTFKNLPYFKYEDQLKGNSFHIGSGDGFEIKPF